MSENCTISRIVPLAESAQSFLSDYEDDNEDSKIMSGIFSNLKYVWYASGPRFQVIEVRTGRKVASWIFGPFSKDVKIVCLSEIPCLSKETPLLIIGLECALTGGTICIFDILTSKILRSIQMNDTVSCIHIIDCGSNIFPILGPLKAFDGVVAVGLVGGDVLLIDLCQQYIDDARVSNTAEDIKGETEICQINPLTIRDIHAIEEHKQKAAQLGSHLSIILNAVLNAKSPHFILKGPKGEDRVHVNKVEVLVTSLFYSSQLGSLLVGYNFGAWQIWNIVNMTLVYTSPIYEENIPVSHFTVQEPTDDPRAFCYVWAIYSNTYVDAGFPIAVMYSLNYEVKDFHEGYGYLYQDLQSCAVRFQTELAAVGDASKDIKGARCLRLTAFNKGCSSRTSIQESHEDTLTICSMIWNAWGTNGVDTYMSIFDLNQWYKEQMPSTPQQNCFSYLSYMCVSDVINTVSNNSILLDVLIDDSSINQFIGIQKPEEHYYPTALTYEFCACTDKYIAFSYNKGQQRTLLGQFDSTDSLILVKPKEIFERSILLGLTPLFADTVQSNLSLQREFLLNIALEQDMIGFLYKCVCTWSNGSFAGMGCSIEFFFNWAWNRAITLKTNADKLCERLFNYLETSLDANNQKILNSCISQLSSLHRLYGLVCKNDDLSLSSIDIIQQQENCLHMIVTYLEVMQWLMNIGLLPEFSESSVRKDYNRPDGQCAPYPIESLLKYYKQRRSSLSNEVSFLYIDTLIENQFGNRLQRLWQDDDGDGYYPPLSLQSLLGIYLVENVDMIHKHCVVIYLFLDLAMALDQLRYKFIITHLIKFPTVFKISSSITKMIQAFWQLDHGDFPTAVDQLLDPHISTLDLKLWHHRIILNALLLQGQHNFALLYFQVRKQPLENMQDILNILSLYIRCHMIDEAMNFCREHSSEENNAKSLRHIFQECTQTNQILEFVDYPLNLKEEEVLMKFLEEISYDRIEEFRVTFYLHRSRYIDIFQMRKNENKFFPSGLQGQKRMGSCDNAMKVITNLFPKVTKDIFNICHYEKNVIQSNVARPKPMSVFVHNADEKVKYKSTLIRAGILKSKETWSHPAQDKSINENFPFIKTPTTSFESRKRTSIICPKIISANSFKSDEEGVSPEKRMKFSVEAPSIPNSAQLTQDESKSNTSCFLDMSRLLTPIVKRKIHKESDSSKALREKVSIHTPQSILKVRDIVTPHFPMNSATHSSDVPSKNPADTLNSPIGTMGLMPRKSLSRSVVRFEKLHESSLTESSELVRTTEHIETTDISSASKSSEFNENSSLSADTFYSPNTSGPDNEDKLSASSQMQHIEVSSNTETEFRAIERDPAIKVIDSKKQIKRTSPKGRSSYRGFSPRLQTVSKESIHASRGNKKDFAIELEATPRRLTRSARVKLQESVALSSPTNPALHCEQSVNELVLENNTNAANSQDFTSSVITKQLNERSSVVNISSISSSASEEFDHMVKGQTFSIPYISLSPMQYSISTELNVTDASEKVEECMSSSTNTGVENETNSKHEKEQFRSYIKVKGRKSLSRMVMERNLSSLYTSTPCHSFTEDVTNESIQSSNKGVRELSKLSTSEQLELDQMIKNQSFDIPNLSLSLNQYSVDSNTSQKDNPFDSYGSGIIREIHTIESDFNLDRVEVDVRTSTDKVSELLMENESRQNKENEKIQINITLDDVNSVARSNLISQDSFTEGETMTANDGNVESNGDDHDQDLLSLQQNLPQSEQEDAEIQSKETLEVIEESTSERNVYNDGSVPETNLSEIGNYADIELSGNIDEFNEARFVSTEIIEIPDSSSSSGESNTENINSKKYSDTEEGNDRSIASTINSDSEILELDKNISPENEDADVQVLQVDTNIEFVSPETSEALVSDFFVEIQHTESRCRHISSTDEVIIEEQQQNNENEMQLDLNVVATQSLSKDVAKNVNATLIETEAVKDCSNVTLHQHMETDHNDNNDLQDNKEHYLPQSSGNLTERNMEENLKINNSNYDNQDDDMTANQVNFLENTSIDVSKDEDITVGDILDTVNIEKSVYGNVSATDILEKSLIDNLNDTKEECGKPLAEEVSTADHGTSKNALNKLERSDNITESTPDHQKMQLRKRSSNTSLQSLSNRALRKRSASTDEVSTRRSKLIASPSEHEEMKSKSQFDVKSIQSNPRILRNRRAVSVSHINDVETENASNSRRQSKRTTSVSDLPRISEEITSISRRISNKNESDIEDENQKDDLEIYSTNRRLTRYQKSLLERSKAKHSLGKICEDDVTHTEEIDKHMDVSSLTSTENKTRMITRRISQESISSIVSTGNSASDAGSPNKKRNASQKRKIDSPKPQALRRGRSKSIDEISVTSQVSKSSRTTRKSEVSDSDDQSTISLRRSTRNRSKTPDIEGSSKTSTRIKKTLSKIAEEDDESKETKTVKQEKSKKK